MSNWLFQTIRGDSATDWLASRLHQAVIGLFPLLLGGQLIFWMVFIPIGLRGDADFSIFYTAGSMVRTGYGHQLYDYDLQLQFENALVSKTPAPYNHLPYEALPFVPVSCLSYRAAYLTFLFFNIVLTIAAFALIQEPSDPRWLPAAIFISYFPVAAAIADGQDSIMLLVIAGSAWWFFSRKWEWLTGALLALGLFRFPIVLPIAGLMFLWKRWRFVAGFALVSATVLSLSAWMVGVNQMRLYAVHLLSLSGLATQEAGYYSLSYALPRMMNLRGFFVNVVQVPHLAGPVTIITSLALLLWVAKRGRAIGRTRQFALAVAFSVLVSYHLFVYDLTILLIPMMAALGLAKQRDSTRAAKTAVLIPLIAVPVGLFWRPFLVAVPLLAFLWILTRAFSAADRYGAGESM